MPTPAAPIPTRQASLVAILVLPAAAPTAVLPDIEPDIDMDMSTHHVLARHTATLLIPQYSAAALD